MAELRKRGEMAWGAALMQFVGENLPNILGGLAEGQEELALQKLVETYRERRAGKIEDRSEQIATNREKVDARLRERKERDKGEPPK